MAITIDDFSKIWASTSPLTPYEFSEDNYKSGWNFVGGTPPSRQMWDFLQKNNDEKMQYLANNYLPLSGGTMTGEIVVKDTTITSRRDVTNSWNLIFGGTTDGDGAYIRLNGMTTSSGAGWFVLKATDGTNSSYFTGHPDGTLTWNGYVIDSINASGSGYVRYENGLQLCYQTVVIPANTTNGIKVFSYPVPFVSTVNTQATPYGVNGAKLITLISALSLSGSQFQIQVATATNTVPSYDAYVYVFSIGYWK